jgi:uncharacterized membrane protein HdeD (DUF308 family)
LTIAGALNMEMSRGRSLLSIAGAVSVLLGVPLAFTAPGGPVMVEWLRTYAIAQAFLFVFLADRLRP